MHARRPTRPCILPVLALAAAVAASCANTPTAANDVDRTEKIALGAPRRASRPGALKLLSDSLRDAISPEAGSRGSLFIVAAAIAYGTLHALGPGHQKTLLSGLVIAEGGSVASVAAAAGIAAASHAASVLALFGGLALAQRGAALSSGDRIGGIVAKASGLILVVIAARSLRARVKAAIKRERGHAHDDCPACSGQVPSRAGRRSTLATMALGSLVPCPGAAFFLLYGFSAGNPLAGVLAVLALSFGMWLTLCVVGLLSLSAWKAGELRASRSSGSGPARLYSAFGIVGGLFVLAFAIGLVL